MSDTGKAAVAAGLWTAVLGYLVLYTYCLLIGFFSVGEMVGFGVVAAALVILFAVHVIRVRRAIRNRDDAHHEEIMRGLHRQRELRGF
jgi:hypothetical protein